MNYNDTLYILLILILFDNLKNVYVYKQIFALVVYAATLKICPFHLVHFYCPPLFSPAVILI